MGDRPFPLTSRTECHVTPDRCAFSTCSSNSSVSCSTPRCSSPSRPKVSRPSKPSTFGCEGPVLGQRGHGAGKEALRASTAHRGLLPDSFKASPPGGGSPNETGGFAGNPCAAGLDEPTEIHSSAVMSSPKLITVGGVHGGVPPGLRICRPPLPHLPADRDGLARRGSTPPPSLRHRPIHPRPPRLLNRSGLVSGWYRPTRQRCSCSSATACALDTAEPEVPGGTQGLPEQVAATGSVGRLPTG